MKHRTLSLIGISLATLLIVVSCSQNSVGIFASIARERLIIDDRELANDLSVGAMTKAGTRYFMASGLLRWRESVDPDLVNGDVSEWSVVTSPGSSADNYITTSVVEFNGAVYASYVHQTGSPSGVYVISAPAATTPTLSADPVFDSDDTGVDRIGELFVVDDGGTPTLLVSVKTTAAGDYALYASTNGTTFTLVDGTDGVGYAWTDVAADGANRDFAFINGVTLLTDTDGINTGVAPGPPTFAPGKAGSAAWRGAHYDGSTLWLSDASGHLYTSPDFGTTDSWVRNASAYRYENDSEEDPISFTDFATVNNTVTDVTVVGTQALGYYVLGADASVTPSSPAVSGSNFRESDLSALAVNTFFVDPDAKTDYPVPTPAGDPYELLNGDLLFVGTANGGLWRALFHDGPTQWVQE